MAKGSRKHFCWARLNWRRPIINIFLILSTIIALTLFYFLAIVSEANLGEGEVVQILSQCGCQRVIKSHPLTKNLRPMNTTCEFETFVRGPHQKVVSFSFFEPINKDKESRKYFEGIKENLMLIKKLYPGFTMRIYHDLKSKSTVMSQLCDLACSEPQLDLCNTNYNPRFGNASVLYPLNWRFLASIDNHVDTFLSRDLDSRISEREVDAVNEFLSDNKTLLHVMRDHPAHASLMLGGTWAAKSGILRPRLEMAFRKFFKDGLAYGKRGYGGLDQLGLVRYIWRWGRKLAMVHDSYLCKKYGNTRSFPSRRKEGVGNFVGSVISHNGSIQFNHINICPLKCRPENHKDWLYC